MYNSDIDKGEVFSVGYKPVWSLGEFIPLSTRRESKQPTLLISTYSEENRICVTPLFVCSFSDNLNVINVPLWSIPGKQQRWFPVEPLSRGKMRFDLNHKTEINSPSWKGHQEQLGVEPGCSFCSAGSRDFCLPSSSQVLPFPGNWQLLIFTSTPPSLGWCLLPSWELKTAERRSGPAVGADSHWFFAALSSHCWTAEMKVLVTQTVVEEGGAQAAAVPPASPKQHLPKYAVWLHFTSRLN